MSVMRTISADTISKLKELLHLLCGKPVTIKEIVIQTSLTNSNAAHKMLSRLSTDYGFNIVASKQNKKSTKCGTRYCVYRIHDSDIERALNISDSVLGKSEGDEHFKRRIDDLMQAGYPIDYICAALDKSRACVLYHAEKNNLITQVRRDKSTPVKPVVTNNDKLTIYMPRPKSLL